MAQASVAHAGPAPREDREVLEVLLEATRALLWITSPADGRNVAAEVVATLGGTVVPAREADGDAIPVDLSFGDGEPVLPSAPAASIARMLLEEHLPVLVQDIRRAVELGRQFDRLVDDAAVDTLTLLPNRRMLGRALGRAQPGDFVIMVDLDHFKQVNDTLGHDSGDQVLKILGHTIREQIRGSDFAGRYGGEEFVIILRASSDPDAFLARLRWAWEAARPRPITFSAGIATVDADGVRALKAADHAMYRAKAAGRDQWAWAASDEVSDDLDAIADTEEPAPQPSFVAFSRLHVPPGGAEEVEAAFQDRLKAVDRWPGFSALEVWGDLADPTSYAMVSWWATPEAFRAYMASDDHKRSHSRIPTGDSRPRPRSFTRFRVVAR